MASLLCILHILFYVLLCENLKNSITPFFISSKEIKMRAAAATKKEAVTARKKDEKFSDVGG
jgi:hypothetical protein